MLKKSMNQFSCYHIPPAVIVMQELWILLNTTSCNISNTGFMFMRVLAEIVHKSVEPTFPFDAVKCAGCHHSLYHDSS